MDPNAPSWLTAEPAAPTTAAISNDKPTKSGGVFKMFSKENATAHVQKAAVTQATTQAQNIASAPDDGFTPAWATSKAYTPPNDIENGVSGAAAAPAAEAVPEQLDVDPVMLKRMQYYHRILRILYMSAAVIMAAAAGLSLVAQTNISAAFFAIYVLFFCLLMCCFEVGLNVRTPICCRLNYCEIALTTPLYHDSTDDIKINSYQFWLHVHAYWASHFLAVRWLHELQSFNIWDRRYGNSLPRWLDTRSYYV